MNVYKKEIKIALKIYNSYVLKKITRFFLDIYIYLNIYLNLSKIILVSYNEIYFVLLMIPYNSFRINTILI